jgi:hypothetical protein
MAPQSNRIPMNMNIQSPLAPLTPFVNLNIQRPLPPNTTPRFQDLDLGTFKERRSRSESRGERICRAFLEQYYGKPFKSTRPDFLQNPLTGRNLELDGYNPEMAMAFEYNGIQHYQYPNVFHKSEEEFEQQLRRDNFKREACDLSGIYLINIPYTVPHTQIPDYIKARLPHNQIPDNLY